MKRCKIFVLTAVASALAFGSTAMAQYVAPTMDPIPEVIDWGTAAEAIMLAGATLLATVFAISIGFRLIHKLKARVTKEV